MAPVPFTEEWMVAPRAAIRIPRGDVGESLIAGIDTSVPGRLKGRRNWHRERYCIAAFMRHLCATAPNVFPAELIRQQSPDFMLVSEVYTRALAIERTDASAVEFQDRLDAEATLSDPEAKFLPPHGSGSADTWRRDLRSAVQRKSSPNRWRYSVPGSARCLLAHELMESFMFVDDDEAHLARGVLADAQSTGIELDCIAVIRGSEVRVWAGKSAADLLRS
ncbi:hypothetical protein [Falsiroseomonas sp.]|uniref:hypothetical protein n=1 Tax=Falsiroseomonas sp. TaxID=2870721 RepID=UPI003567F34B